MRQNVEPVVRVKRAVIPDNYNEMTLFFEKNFAVTFRVYDHGVAYRMETSLSGKATIDAEQVAYHFPKAVKGTFPIADGFFTHYERNYTDLRLSELPVSDMSCLPALLHFDKGVKAVITEADLYDYPGFYLQKDSGNALKAVFPNYPATTNRPDDRDVVPVTREPYLAITNGTRTFPWRLLVISDKDSELIENELVFLLSRELQLDDTDWIRPGKVAWDWYNANNIYGVDFEAGINTATYQYYIDFAARYGLEYIILDEGWYDIKTNDLLHPVAAIDMEKLSAYAKQKNVGLILWVTWTALDENFDAALDQFQRWGIKGIKVDFMQRDDQWMVQYYEKVANGAVKRKLLVDFHGSYKPAGLRRAYPNVLTREGVKGLEQHKWKGQMANPENDLLIPFIRMLAGPMDYTPGAMANAQLNNYAPIWNRPMSLGTRCHQLAMYVVYESPLQMLADSPSSYLREPECMELLAEVPVVWDDTEVLQAQLGDYLAVARRSGNTWYIGAMTDWEERTLELDLSFLGAGTYDMTIYQDGVNANRFASDYKKTTRKVRAGEKLSIRLAKGGGWVGKVGVE